MTRPIIPKSTFPTAEEDVNAARLSPDTAQTRSSSYRLAYTDDEFLLRDELREESRPVASNKTEAGRAETVALK